MGMKIDAQVGFYPINDWNSPLQNGDVEVFHNVLQPKSVLDYHSHLEIFRSMSNLPMIVALSTHIS